MAKGDVASSGKGGTSIYPCTCHHDFQDKRYGKGRRVWNRAPGQNGWRCTVCEKVRKD